jgi:hypothetical protein
LDGQAKGAFPLNVKILLCSALPIGILLVVGGFVVLIYVIPKVGMKYKDSESRTEFYSVRAAYWSVLAGLFVLIVSVVSLASCYAISTTVGGK